MSDGQVDGHKSTSALGYLLGTIGILMAGAVIIKACIIGYYPHDVPILAVLAFGGAALLWIAEKLL